MRITASASSGCLASQRRDQLAVAEQRLRALLVVGPERRLELARDAGHGAHRRGQPRRAGGLDDDPVELLVVDDLVGGLRGAPLRLVAQRAHAVELVAVDPGRRARGGMRLDQRADLVEVEQVAAIERAHDRAAVGLDRRRGPRARASAAPRGSACGWCRTARASASARSRAPGATSPSRIAARSASWTLIALVGASAGTLHTKPRDRSCCQPIRRPNCMQSPNVNCGIQGCGIGRAGARSAP